VPACVYLSVTRFAEPAAHRITSNRHVSVPAKRPTLNHRDTRLSDDSDGVKDLHAHVGSWVE